LESLAVQAEWFAANYRERPGPKPNLALVDFVERVGMIIRRRCGAETVLCHWDAYSGEYVGRLYELIRFLQPLLPSEPGSIASAGPIALGKRLLRALEYARWMHEFLGHLGR
jgi:hypothetical protein